MFGRDGHTREAGLALLAEVREEVRLRDHFSYAMLGFMDVLAATVQRRQRGISTQLSNCRGRPPTSCSPTWRKYLADRPQACWWKHSFVVADRGGDIDAAQAAAGSGGVGNSRATICLLFDSCSTCWSRAVARARGDENRYREVRGSLSATATSLGFHGHIAAAKAMT